MVSESDSDVGNPGSVRRLAPWFKHSVPDPAGAPSDSDSGPGPRPPRALVQGPGPTQCPALSGRLGQQCPGRRARATPLARLWHAGLDQDSEVRPRE